MLCKNYRFRNERIERAQCAPTRLYLSLKRACASCLSINPFRWIRIKNNSMPTVYFYAVQCAVTLAESISTSLCWSIRKRVYPDCCIMWRWMIADDIPAIKVAQTFDDINGYTGSVNGESTQDPCGVFASYYAWGRANYAIVDVSATTMKDW